MEAEAAAGVKMDEKPASTTSEISLVAPWGLYLGGNASASDARLLRELGITTVVNLAEEIPNHFEGDESMGIKYVKVATVDSAEQDMAAAWAATHEAVQATHAAGGKCLVHCKGGKSRSASAVAYCMVRAGADLPSSMDHLRSCRPVTEVSESFQRQLEAVSVGPPEEAAAFAEVLPRKN